ncbi:hypothetical protein EWB00_007809 [Schistosoma japonicum]|uniref:Uncharacterized protein n=1 Tax=Schistosoma japonicum TaxID=6182 RepID=A0A4Z2CSX1_SCHJA|nr:hypothetical protein EWB00_007809 [Schistosoma japonicum]
MSLDHFKNLAYYLLTTDYASYHNEQLKYSLQNSIKKNNTLKEIPLKSRSTTANANDTVAANISSDNTPLPVLSKFMQQKKHYSFLMTMLKRDSLLPESLWIKVYNQLCDDFVHELNSSHLKHHQFTSTNAFVTYVIQCLGRSFSLENNIIQLTDIALSELPKCSNNSNGDNTSTDEKIPQQILGYLTQALANTLSKYPIYSAYKQSSSSSEIGNSYVSSFRKRCKDVLEYCLSHFQANYLVFIMGRETIYDLPNTSTNNSNNDDDISSSSHATTIDRTHGNSFGYRNYSIAELAKKYGGLQAYSFGDFIQLINTVMKLMYKQMSSKEG